MNGEPWERVKEIVADALDLDVADREAFLDRACGDDASLRARAGRLVALDASAEQFLSGTPTLIVPESHASHAAHESLDAAASRPLPAAPPERIGQYRIVRRIASGGMGTVFEAIQDQPHRSVALKLLNADFESGSIARRFERESQLLAQLQHPGIAHVYEAGVHDDGLRRTPYIAMELVRNARTITAYAEEAEHSVDDRVRLMIEVCKAVQHGHDHGVVHRDLKPPNILVGADGHPKVIDFGTARVTGREEIEHTIQTNLGDIIGTLWYMSPEQTYGRPDDIGGGADVYALGVVLFEMLAGCHPLELAGLDFEQALRVIRLHPPQRLGRIVPTAGRALDAITAKALAKDPARRYPTVDAFAADLQRYLQHEPVTAQTPSPLYHAHLFTRRHRLAVFVGSAAVVALVAATIVSTVFAVRANSAAERAEQERATAEAVVEHLRGVLRAPDPHMHPDAAEVTLLEQLERLSIKLDSDQETPPLVEGIVRYEIGRTFLGVRRFERARPQIERAVELLRSYERGRRELVEALSLLAIILDLAGEDDAAERAAREAMDRHEALPLDQRGMLPDIMHNLASILIDQGRLREAEELIDRMTEIRLQRQEHAESVLAIKMMAVVAWEGGNLEGTERILEKAIATSRILPESHPLVSTLHRDLGRLLIDRNRPAEALAAFERGWRIADTHRAPGSHDWVWALRRYATGLDRMGRGADAKDLIDTQLERLGATLSPDHDCFETLRSVRGAIESG